MIKETAPNMHGNEDCRAAGTLSSLLVLILGLLLAAPAGRAAAAEADASVIRRDYMEHLRKTRGVVDIRVIHDCGAGRGAFNVMVVSAGYGAKDTDVFFAMCNRLKNTLFSQGPWKRYQDMINVYGVLVDDEGLDKTRVHVDGYKGQILGCQNQPAIQFANYAAKSDATVVIHNSTFATASCGPWAVVTGNRDTAVNVLTLHHELGHSVGGLGDTYVHRQGAYDGSLGSLWEGKNGTGESNPLLTQWHYWTQDMWPGVFGSLKLPEGSQVGNYEGGAWAKKFYRPEPDCVMHCAGSLLYCTVCNEVMETCFFRTITMFDHVSPAPGEVVLWKGESQTFSLKAMKFICEPPAWLESQLDFYVDGKQTATSRKGEVAFQFGGAMATPGYHQLGANLSVQPERVRRDDGFLTRSRAWRVKVMPFEKPRLKPLPGVTVAQGNMVKAPARVEHSRMDLVDIRMSHAPQGASLQNGSFEWLADKPGSWRVDFTVSIEQQVAFTESLEIHVKQNGSDQEAVELNKLKPVDAIVGKETTITCGTAAGKGRHLLYQLLNASEGMALDRSSGKIVWTPRLDQIGPQRLRFRVSNGSSVKEGNVLIGVRAEAEPYLNSCCTVYPNDRLKRLEQLKKSPLIYERIFELTCMLRERFSKSYTPALAEAKTMYADLSPELRETCLQELLRHAWTFTDRPSILQWMEEISNSGSSEYARRLSDEVKNIRLWSKVKQAELGGDPKQLGSLLALLSTTDREAVHAAIRRAVRTLYGKSDNKGLFRSEVLTAMQKDKGRVRAALMPMLALIDLQDTVLECVRDANEDVVRSALATLTKTGRQSEIGPLSKLLVVSPDRQRRVAMEQALNAICARVSDRGKSQEPMLATLAETTGPGRTILLQLLPLVKEPKLDEVLTRSSKDPDRELSQAARKAQKYLLDEIGATDAYVASWNLSGPYLLANNKTVFAPETGAKAAWKPYNCRAKTGPRIVPLKDIFGGNSRVAYMKAIVRSGVEQKVLFGAGSDDGIEVWLNGTLIHSQSAIRAVNPDQDKFFGTLRAGENTILCKITQNTLDWGACLSIRAPNGGPALGVSVVPLAETPAGSSPCGT
ncbi:MAG: M64 family metallopeptidase [Planctomycetaceae bacterium]|nr:M64 family metallopeptidase [Planctomycetaceae bacterium]